MVGVDKTYKFMEWFQKSHSVGYNFWRNAVQRATSMLVTSKATGESDENFKLRLQSKGAPQFQAAMWHVHDAMCKSQCWAELSEAHRKLLMQASQIFLLRVYRNRGLDVIRSREVEMVDKRLNQLYKALSSSLELQHWKFEPAIKEAIAGSDQSFAKLVQAAEALVSLEESASDVADPLHILSVFEQFTQGIISFLNSKNSEATMDAQVDVAVHTLVQLAPPGLYYHVSVVEKLLWEPWSQPSDAQFAVMLMTSVVIALYTINTSHFDMDSHLFLGIMASQGFNVQEFEVRDSKVGLPPPFGIGPPLGHGGRSEPSSSTSKRSGGNAAHTPPLNVSKYLGKLEKSGMAIVQGHGLPSSFAKLYPFILQQPEDLFLHDVAELLNEYKNIALKYEALKAGIGAEKSS